MSTIIGVKEALDGLSSSKGLLVWKDSFQYHFRIVDKTKAGTPRTGHKHFQHKGIFVLDKYTGITYISRVECGRQLAHLVNKAPDAPNVYYALKKRFWKRFVESKEGK